MTNTFDLIVATLRVFVVFGIIMGIVPMMIWMERKGAAYIQDRRGPNRAAIMGIRLGGLIHSLADALKLLTKTDVTGSRVVRPLFFIAPMIAMSLALITAAVIPFAEPIEVSGIELSLQIADLPGGLLYVLALSSLGVYALLIGGWASFGKYSLLGALRASAQMISYELAMGLSVVAIFLVSGSFRLTDIVLDQGALPWTWNIIRQPLAFLIFATAMLAETNRLPFDLPEGENELVAGYHTEYSSMRFAMFFMGEYSHIVVGSLIMATVFLGGWQIPFVSVEDMFDNVHITLWVSIGTLGTMLFLIGAILIRRFRRRYKDLRDYEVLIFGAPCALVGIALISWVTYMAITRQTLIPAAASIMIFFIQLVAMLVKTMILASCFIWVRWTLPRFRYDQLMHLGWQIMLPLGLINVVATALILLII